MIINKAIIKIIEKTLQLKMQDITNEDALLRAFIALAIFCLKFFLDW